MEIFHSIRIWFIVFLSLIGCSHYKPQPPERLPEDEVAAYRDASIKMSKYIVLEDSVYSLSISKVEAINLGIEAKYYDRIIQDLNYTNYIVREEYIKKGIPIEMPRNPVDIVPLEDYE